MFARALGPAILAVLLFSAAAAFAQAPSGAPVVAPVALTPAQSALIYNGTYSSIPINYPFPEVMDWVVLTIIFCLIAAVVHYFPAHLYGDSKTNQKMREWYTLAASNQYTKRIVGDIASEFAPYFAFVPVLFGLYTCFSSNWTTSFAVFYNDSVLQSLLWASLFIVLAGLVVHGLWYQNIGAFAKSTYTAWFAVAPLLFAAFGFAVVLSLRIVLQNYDVNTFTLPMTSLLAGTIVSAVGIACYVVSAVSYGLIES